MKTFLRLAIALLASVVLFSGCAAFDPLPHDLAAAKQQIAKWVPDGTVLPEAQRRLEQRDFKCRVVTNERTQKKSLVCTIKGKGVLAKRQWSARFEIQQGAVTDLQVGSDLVGP